MGSALFFSGVLRDALGWRTAWAIYAGMAIAAGFKRARTIDTVPELAAALPAIVAEDGPSFTVLRVEPESADIRGKTMNYEGPELKYRFGRAMERRFGIEVFGPSGY